MMPAHAHVKDGAAAESRSRLLGGVERERLERAAVDAAERERRRLGQALHDRLCPELAGLAFLAKVLARSLTKENSPAAEQAAVLGEAIQRAVGAAQDLSRRFNPGTLNGAGFREALETLARETSAALPCRLEVPALLQLDDPQQAGPLFHIAEEAVNNARRHADAGEIVVKWHEEEDGSVLEISDNGRGFRLENVGENAFGLEMMRARSIHINAALRIVSELGQGTAILCKLPRLPSTQERPT